MTATPFYVEMRPDQIIYDRPVALETLLAYALREEYLDQGRETEEAVELAHRTIPIVCRDGVFCASSAIIPAGQVRPTTFIASLEAHLRRVPDVERYLQKNPRLRSTSPDFYRVDKAFPASMDVKHVLQLPKDAAIYFLATGDISRCSELLGRITHLGAKSGTGHGRLRVPPMIHPIEQDWKDYGIISPSGMVLRPVPKRLADQWGMRFTRFSLAEESWQVPRWKTPYELCYVPPRRHYPSYEIVEIMGVSLS